MIIIIIIIIPYDLAVLYNDVVQMILIIPLIYSSFSHSFDDRFTRTNYRFYYHHFRIPNDILFSWSIKYISIFSLSFIFSL